MIGKYYVDKSGRVYKEKDGAFFYQDEKAFVWSVVGDFPSGLAEIDVGYEREILKLETAMISNELERADSSIRKALKMLDDLIEEGG